MFELSTTRQTAIRSSAEELVGQRCGGGVTKEQVVSSENDQELAW